VRPNSARRGDPASPMKLGSAAAVTLGMMSSNHTKAHSLEERFRDVESVDLVGLGHDRVLGLDVAFRHGAALSRCLWRRGKLRERAQLTRERARAFRGPEVGETGLWGSYMSQCRVKGSVGRLLAAGAQIEAAGDNSENKSLSKWSFVA
jgi:hypothetical protein